MLLLIRIPVKGPKFVASRRPALLGAWTAERRSIPALPLPERRPVPILEGRTAIPIAERRTIISIAAVGIVAARLERRALAIRREWIPVTALERRALGAITIGPLPLERRPFRTVTTIPGPEGRALPLSAALTAPTALTVSFTGREGPVSTLLAAAKAALWRPGRLEGPPALLPARTAALAPPVTAARIPLARSLVITAEIAPASGKAAPLPAGRPLVISAEAARPLT